MGERPYAPIVRLLHVEGPRYLKTAMTWPEIDTSIAYLMSCLSGYRLGEQLYALIGTGS